MSVNSGDPPFAVIDSTDRSGLLWITAALSLTYFGLSCLLRAFISFRSFHRDTFILILGSVRFLKLPINPYRVFNLFILTAQ